MSVEASAGKSIPIDTVFSILKEHRTFNEHALVVSQRYIDEAHEELLSQTTRLRERGVSIDPTRPIRAQLPEEEKESFEINKAKGVLGITVMELSAVIESGIASNLVPVLRYNQLVEGTFVSPATDSKLLIDSLSRRQHERLIKAAETSRTADRSFSIFFEGKYGLMPSILRDFVQREQALNGIRLILPQYRRDVTDLVMQKVKEWENETNRDALLSAKTPSLEPEKI